jgi:uncharacterized SAM-binding protein YcdF (DUF218 family)
MPRPPSPRRRRLRVWAVWFGILALAVSVLLAEHRPLLEGFAASFRVNDPVKSDALVLLLGGPDHRPRAAADLYNQGLAPLVLMGDSGLDPDLKTIETDVTRRALESDGVPAAAIQLLAGGEVHSTRDEALRVRDYARAHPTIRTITVVTTAFHTARSRWIFKRVLRGSGVEVHMAVAPLTVFDEVNWYKSGTGRVIYLSETIKTVYYRLAY